MTHRRLAPFLLSLSVVLIAAGCGGSDGDTSVPAPDDADAVENDDADEETTSDAESDSSASETTAGFGDLIEGSFVLAGAAEERFEFGDAELAFRTVGGCEGGAFGFGVHVTDAAGTKTFATFGAEGQEDLSGGATGEFDAVEFEATIFPEGDMSLAETAEGPVTMVISEHDTGGADFDLNARRMTVELVGTVPSDNGDVDVDITYRWVMGCP